MSRRSAAAVQWSRCFRDWRSVLFEGTGLEMSATKDLPTSGLLERALELSKADGMTEERAACVDELHRRGEPEIFEKAKTWCTSDEVVERILGADILGQLGCLRQDGEEQHRPYTRPSIPLLARLLDDPDSGVVSASVRALDHHYAPTPIAERDFLASHPSKLVRKSVASALGWSTSPSATDMLVRLSNDEDDDVRDWATFSLGSLCCLDTPDVREALFRRLNDNHFDTRAEALVGLAKRKDERVVPFVRAALEAEIVGTLAVEAAGEIASGELVEPLEALVGWWAVDTELLQAALKSCKGDAGPDDQFWNDPGAR